MRKAEPKYRRPLNQELIEILELLYKFRFVTVATIKEYFSESNPGMNVFKRLETLEGQGFIAKRYFENYQLLHKPVVYYLLPDGARKLATYREANDTDEINVKALYRDSDVSEQFAMHCVAVFKLYNRLVEQYGDELDLFSKSDQASFENFPKPLPDAYVSHHAGSETTNHFFIDILDDDAHLLPDATKKVKRYTSYRRSGSWAVRETPFPTIIFICNSPEACERVQKRCESKLRSAWVTDIRLSVGTVDTIELE